MAEPKAPAKTAKGEVASQRSTRSEIDAFLKDVRALKPSGSGQGRLIFAMDATMSRQPSWDLALELQADMFKAVKAVGGLDVQLVYFRGYNECQASKWVGDPDALARLMRQVSCAGGFTQISKVLSHARRESAIRQGQRADLCRRLHGGRCGPAGPARRRARHDRHPGVRVPGGSRLEGRARLQGDRPALARRLCAVRCRLGAGSCASCSPLSRSMPRAGARR